MRKKIVLPMIFVLFAACSSPMLEWIESGAGPSLFGLSDKGITAFSFGFSNETDTIRTIPDEDDRTPIKVVLPEGSETNNLIPTIEYIGKSISPGSGEPRNFNSPVTYWVTAEDGSVREYEVEVIVKTPESADLIRFDLELPGGGSFMAEGDIVEGTGSQPGTVTLHVPSETDTSSLTAKIVQTGVSLLAPNGTNYSGIEISQTGNFSAFSKDQPETNRTYTVTPANGNPKKYVVTIIVNQSDVAGIFDFKVTNVPNSSVSIGQKPRKEDERIPIIIQVPYGTDETNMIAAITLSRPLTSTVNPLSDTVIPFGNKGKPKEAVYIVTAQSGAKQEYVAIVSAGGQYYYVDGKNGNDLWPDYYNGETEGQAFKTLARAVAEAAKPGSTITKIFILGDLTADNQMGANTDSALSKPGSVITIDLSTAANKKLTIASTAGSTLRGASGKRVLNVTGGADLTFENISITGGNTPVDGGGINIIGNSTVKFSGGNVTGNTARSGGGIYVGGNSTVSFSGNIAGNTAKSGGGVYVEGMGYGSMFDFKSGEISGNVATGTELGDSDVSGMDGGGGVYVKDNATFWLEAAGTISSNTTKGAGGGVLVNGSDSTEDGLIMYGGRIVNNTSTSWTSPHGGGGVYVAHGLFAMFGGDVTSNSANRQGGGVFVHWGDARFTASGTSRITDNVGTGSSKAICNRGITALIGSAQADYVYVWDYDDYSDPSPTPPQSFTLANNVQITKGVALAYSATNKNFIEFVDGFTGAGTGQIAIDLEGHLDTLYRFAGQLEPDWRYKNIIAGTNNILTMMLPRLHLNTFTGIPSVYDLAGPLATSTGYKYEISVLGGATEGTFERQP